MHIGRPTEQGMPRKIIGVPNFGPDKSKSKWPPPYLKGVFKQDSDDTSKVDHANSIETS